MRGRMIAAGALAASSLVALAAPAGAAPADGNGRKLVEVSVGEVVPGLGAVLEGACAALGYDVGTVTVSVDGWSQGLGATTVFHYVATAVSSNGTSTSAMDVGPDRVFQRDGRTFVSVTGRSLTGSGVIGRVVYEIGATGNVIGIVHQAGNDRWVEGACADLA